eukprot:CAMPEP_0170551924 /NCGR_PEP_ID=MMETSP0211-20121228/9916_1 /TAXON_ID=311385 /ORGANISM="Pseudokeronopsis sp., Strain OXSARD2" /LENGTH=93 /DNA_ID=CAMNT_0010859393 /DNA_START=854 /DNA_END=1135 /DNA_ORIENTATION=+
MVQCSANLKKIAVAGKFGVQFATFTAGTSLIKDGKDIYTIEVDPNNKFFKKNFTSSVVEYAQNCFCVGIRDKDSVEMIGILKKSELSWIKKTI